MEAINFETLVRRAFGYITTGRMVDRWGDPAQLANTDQFREENLAAVKVGAGYAIEIFTNEILNKKGETLSGQEYSRLEQFTNKIVSAKDLKEVSLIVDEFEKTVEKRYFRFDDGVMSLK